MPVNASEAFVHYLCTGTFLSLYSIGNPFLKKGKELCDILVICDPDLLIWSVKHCDLADADSVTHLRRWQKRAVSSSAKQIYGAERILEGASKVPVPGKKYNFPLPTTDRRIHRLAVALGSKGLAPIGEADFGKGFVHVFNEQSLQTVLTELDTIADFVEYLQSKEHLLTTTQVITHGGEEDLLAIYLHNGRSFPDAPDLLIVEPAVWDDLRAKPEWIARKEEDMQSYVWDRLIETFMSDFHEEALVAGQSLEEFDAVIRVMAREDRFSRRLLAKTFLDFMAKATADKVRSRIVRSPSGVTYVYLVTSRSFDRDARRAELAARCFVARGMVEGAETVIGIATERYEGKPGFSFDAMRFVKPDWTAIDSAELRRLQEELGIFRDVERQASNEDEFPKSHG
jgi:hypothetical protein